MNPVLAIVTLHIILAPCFPTAADPPTPIETTPQQIQTWLEELNDPSHATREAAVSKLYAAGPAALAALEHVAREGDFEASLRARGIINRIQKLFLVGTRVELAVDRERLKWDEPLNLRLKIVNPSAFPIHLPFLVKDRQSIDADSLASQVGTFLDTADFLVVKDPDSRQVQPTVDDYRGHAQLEKAVDVRAYLEPASLLEPHSEIVMTLEAFNRGFARFRMLEAGEYRVQFLYVPEWDLAEMMQNRLGLITSNEVHLTVTEAAPELIRRADRPIQIALAQAQDTLVVRAIGTHDRPIGLNTNLGAAGSDEHATLSWLWESPAGIVTAAHPSPQISPAVPDKLITLKPADSVEVLRLSPGQLRSFAGFEKLPVGQPIRLAIRYTNLLDKALVQRKLGSPGPDHDRLRRLHETLPLPMFTGSQASSFVEFTPGPAASP